MSNTNPNPDGDTNGSPSPNNAKGSPVGASLNDPREPWRIAVAAAEASADALLRYADEVAALRRELDAAIVSADTMRDLRDRVVDVEQTLRNQPAQQPPVQTEVSIPPIMAWLIFLIVLWLAALSGVLAGRSRSESEGAKPSATVSLGGNRP